MLEQIVRGPLLVPESNGRVSFYPDGALVADADGTLQFVGNFAELKSDHPVRKSAGIMLPPLLDIHTHIPQHPIRGRFVEGISDDAPGGKLLAGLERNVFPAEARCGESVHAENVVKQFLGDTLAHGVVGGAAYMTPSALATEIALSLLPDSWQVGLVLMNQNCPASMLADEANLDADIERLAKKFGRRLIVTDRFAVAVNSTLRRRAAALAEKFDLRTQTHLNEQVAEKQLVEKTLYPTDASYTDIYRQDGLLDHSCIAAHCIQMREEEWNILRDSGTTIAHCPTSNLLLGSGRMDLDLVLDRRLPFAIATDVGASPTVSMLAEMNRFITVHQLHAPRATAEQALFRSTRAPADLLEMGNQFGKLQVGQPLSFIEVDGNPSAGAVEDVIRSLLPADLDCPSQTVNQVTLAGKSVWRKERTNA